MKFTIDCCVKKTKHLQHFASLKMIRKVDVFFGLGTWIEIHMIMKFYYLYILNSKIATKKD